MAVSTEHWVARDALAVEMRRSGGLSWQVIADYLGMSRSGVRGVVAKAGVTDIPPLLPGAEEMLRRPDESAVVYADRLSDGWGARGPYAQLWARLVLEFYGNTDPEVRAAMELARLRARRVVTGDAY